MGCPQATAIQIEGLPVCFPISGCLRALAVTAVLCGAIAPASAHEGHDHGEQPPVSAGALPRGEADSDVFEIVAIVRGENLEIYLDRFATNEPVTGATLEVEFPGGPEKLRRAPPAHTGWQRRGWQRADVRTLFSPLQRETPPTFCH